ncbi:uncharacterized protein LOC133294692 [Gastrolobium bilobum]|uniref:uncharacterized protein LOC133294692 n=1 Tax=Gastrolobium bilobum TaxID=150636 RepID=UPI002AB1565E|nr:uncharacterized protein LOC133294692 [Gastrolobium bilobum]
MVHKTRNDQTTLVWFTWFFCFCFTLLYSACEEQYKGRMIPWASPCGNKCTNKYAALTKIPWRVFCKKGCNSDGETWEECLEDCEHICYKDPVLKDQQWSAYIDRSPGAASYSEECFHACVSGCGYKFEVEPDEVDKASPKRPEPEPVQKPKPKPVEPINPPGDMPTSA